MRILHCIRSLDPVGGGPVEFVTQLANMPDCPDNIEVVAMDAEDSAFGSQLHCPVTFVGAGLGNYGLNTKLISWLRANATRFDVIVVHGLWQFTSFGTLLAIKDMNVPYVLMPHGMLDPWFRQAYPLKHLKKSAYWAAAEQHTLKNARALIFTTQSEMQLANNAFVPYLCNPKVAALGIADPIEQASSGWEHFAENFPQLKNRNYCLFFGRLHEKKGCNYVIEAFNRLGANYPFEYLVMAGPGDACQLQSQANESAQGDRILFTGMLREQSKWGALAGAAALILPSHQENFGIAVVEAMALSTPVLISNKVNIHDVVQHSDAGLVESDDLNGTIRLMERFSGLTDEERATMGRNARSCFLNNYEITGAYAAFRAVLQQSISEASAHV